MNFDWSFHSSASELIGSVEVLEAKIAPCFEHRLRLGEGLGLHLAVLEHRLDDQVAVLDRGIVRRRGDAREHRVALRLGGAAAGDVAVDHALRMRLALVGAGLVAVDQHHVDAGLRRDEADAGAHEARADDAELLHLGRRHVLRPARALVQFLHRDEQAADHRRRFLGLQDVREVARLDAQRRIHRQLQTLIDALHDGARGRIVVVGLLAVERIRRREHHHALLGIDRHRNLEALLVPGRCRLAAALDPVLRRLDQIGGRHDGVDQLERLRAVELQLLALQHDHQRIGRLQHARQPLRAAGAREQADLDLGQAEPGLRIVGGDAIVARQRQLEARRRARGR